MSVLAAPPPPARGSVRRWLTSLLMISAAGATLVVWSPFLMVLAAGVIATQLGCRSDEAAVYPCFIAGRDIGGTLYLMGVMGWIAIALSPVMLGTVVAWLVFALVHLALRMRGQAGSP